MIVKKIDTMLYYIMLLFALSSSISAMGERNSAYVAIFLLLIRYAIEPFKIEIDRDIRKAVGVLIGTLFFVSFFSYHPVDSFKEVGRTIFRFAPVILVMPIIKNKQQYYSLFAMMTLSIIASDSYAIWQGIHGDFRARAFTSNPMHLAGILIQAIPLFFILAAKGDYSGSIRTFFFSTGVLSSIALIFNGTRGAWIAVVVTMLIYTLMTVKKSARSLSITVVVLVMLGLLVTTVPQVQNRVESIVDMNYQSNSERLLLWRSAGQMFYDHPFVGIGYSQFKELYSSKYISPLAKEPDLPHAHNNFMQFLAETGIVGLASFIYFWWIILRKNYRLYAENIKDDIFLAIFLATIGLLVQGITEYNFGNMQVMHFYWFIVALGYCSVLDKSSDSK
jgi:O-antigen ligase